MYGAFFLYEICEYFCLQYPRVSTINFNLYVSVYIIYYSSYNFTIVANSFQSSAIIWFGNLTAIFAVIHGNQFSFNY